MDYKPLTYIFQPSDDKDAPTLLLLHGTGGDERDLLPLAREFGTAKHVLSVRGNVMEGGMPRFFRRLGMGIFDEEDVAHRTHELVDFLQKLAEEKGFDVRKIVALGYSNGANIAGGILMLYPDFLAGGILLRPMQPLSDKKEFKSSRHQPLFMSSGRQDPTVDPDATQRYVHLLKENGFEVSHHELPAGHQLSQQDLTLAVQWYQEHFGK